MGNEKWRMANAGWQMADGKEKKFDLTASRLLVVLIAGIL
jgi:hypothetical protein